MESGPPYVKYNNQVEYLTKKAKLGLETQITVPFLLIISVNAALPRP